MRTLVLFAACLLAACSTTSTTMTTTCVKDQNKFIGIPVNTRESCEGTGSSDSSTPPPSIPGEPT